MIIDFGIFMWWVKTLCSHQVSQPDPLSLLSQVAGVKAIGIDRSITERFGGIIDHIWECNNIML